MTEQPYNPLIDPDADPDSPNPHAEDENVRDQMGSEGDLDHDSEETPQQVVGEEPPDDESVDQIRPS